MSVARSVVDALRDDVVLELETIYRIYLNALARTRDKSDDERCFLTASHSLKEYFHAPSL